MATIHRFSDTFMAIHTLLAAQAISVVNLELAPALLSNDQQMKRSVQ
jgi:hypothetical protein